jgi:hypothetical protein
MPNPPKNESFAEWLGYLAQILDRDNEEFPFVVSLLSFALTNGGLSDKQAKWANRLIYPVQAMLEKAGHWPPPPQKAETTQEGNVVFLKKKEEFL